MQCEKSIWGCSFDFSFALTRWILKLKIRKNCSETCNLGSTFLWIELRLKCGRWQCSWTSDWQFCGYRKLAFLLIWLHRRQEPGSHTLWKDRGSDLADLWGGYTWCCPASDVVVGYKWRTPLRWNKTFVSAIRCASKRLGCPVQKLGLSLL